MNTPDDDVMMVEKAVVFACKGRVIGVRKTGSAEQGKVPVFPHP
jgi:hypothetical protein